MTLFQQGMFRLHSGSSSHWKIECDALTDEDLHALSIMLIEVLPPYGAVEGVPHGGLRLAEWMWLGSSHPSAPLLIVDDVLTSGGSMEAHRAGRDTIGAVLFARRACPSWVTPLFQMPL